MPSCSELRSFPLGIATPVPVILCGRIVALILVGPREEGGNPNALGTDDIE